MIGTPLCPSATKVMLLGSGELGKEVIIALQRLGIETIAREGYRIVSNSVTTEATGINETVFQSIVLSHFFFLRKAIRESKLAETSLLRICTILESTVL